MEKEKTPESPEPSKTEEKPKGLWLKLKDQWDSEKSFWENIKSIYPEAMKEAEPYLKYFYSDYKYGRRNTLTLVVVIELVAIVLLVLFMSMVGDFFVGKVYLRNVLPLLLGAPIAFPIWYWRDQNKKAEIQNTRDDLRQNDFHKIQEWAASSVAFNEGEQAPEEKKEKSTKETEKPMKKRNVLQVAAIHQLRPYVTGLHGEYFMRPALEIYRSLLETWRPTEEEIEEWKKDDKKKPEPLPYIEAIHTIIRENSNEKPKPGLKYFRDMDLTNINLNFANLNKVDFQGADLQFANFHGAYLRGADLQGTNLMFANFQRANLRGAYLRGAILLDADLRGADLRVKNLDKVTLDGAKYSKETKFPDGFKPEDHGMVLKED